MPLAGALEMEIGGFGGKASGLRAAAILGGQHHSFVGADDNAFLVIDIPNMSSRPPMPGQQRFWDAVGDQPFVDFDPEIAGHLDFLASTVRVLPIFGIRAVIASKMTLDSLARGVGLGSEERLPEPVTKAVRLIETCVAAPLSVADIAGAAGLSPSRLHALLRSSTGMSPMRYLAAERARRVAFLLETTDYSVVRIALEVGYSDQSAIARAFRRETGGTPQQHRDRRRKK